MASVVPSIPEWHASTLGFALGTLSNVLDDPRPLWLGLGVATGREPTDSNHWRDCHREPAYFLVSMLAGYVLPSLFETPD